MFDIPSRHLRTCRDLLVAGGFFAWALFQVPDARPDKPRHQQEVAGSASLQAAVEPVLRTEESPDAPDLPKETNPEFPARARQMPTRLHSISSREIHSSAASPEAPPITAANHHRSRANESGGDTSTSPSPDGSDHSFRSTSPHRTGMRGHSLPGELPQEPVKSSIAFTIPESGVVLSDLEDEVIYRARQNFAEEMKASPVADPASPEYAAHWRRAVETHDDYLRRTLGWDAFNRLSALASQLSHAETAQ